MDAWQAAAGGVDVRAMMTAFAEGDLAGGTAQLTAGLREAIGVRATELIPTLMTLIAPVLLHALLLRLLKGKAVGEAACTVCFLVEAGALVALFSGEVGAAREALLQTGALSEKLYPLLCALLTAGGGVNAAAFLQSASGILTALLTPVYRISFALCSVAAALAIAGNMSERLRLGGLFSLIRSAHNWMIGLTLTLFLAAMGAMGLLGAAQDGAVMQTAKYTVDSLIPVVGGEVADALDSVAASAVLMRNAAGVTGAALVLGSCLIPIVQLAMAVICVQLAGALTEPISHGRMSSCLDQFGKTLKMLLASLTGGAALMLTLVGAILRALNAVAMLGG